MMPREPATFRPRPRREKVERDRDHDRKRRADKPWRGWYGLKVWRDLRSGQLAAQPLCERCLVLGDYEPATVCNHVVAHRGDWSLFVGGPFESLCKRCHDGQVQIEERAAARLLR